jgi:hypothetical protein
MIDPRYPGLSTAIVQSILWRVGAAAIDAFAKAWPASRTATAISGIARLRGLFNIALIAAAAGAIALVMQLAIPSYVRSGLPLMWPIAAIILLAIVGVWAKAFERAWKFSQVARWSTTSRSPR